MRTLVPAAVAALAIGFALIDIQPVEACHRFHVWRFPYPQRCSLAPVHALKPMVVSQLQIPESPQTPGSKSPGASRTAKLEEGEPIVLPTLEPFQPAPEGPERLKGIGMLRAYWGTN
jgi:hypothetical protein